MYDMLDFVEPVGLIVIVSHPAQLLTVAIGVVIFADQHCVAIITCSEYWTEYSIRKSCSVGGQLVEPDSGRPGCGSGASDRAKEGGAHT